MALTIETKFRVGGEADDRRFKAAQELAAQLSSVPCSWHGQCAKVLVKQNHDLELEWAINGSCCEEFQKELTKVIEEASS